MDEIFLTGIEVATLLHISRAHSYNLLRSGKIPVLRLGKAVRVRQSDLLAFIERSISGKPSDQTTKFQE